MGSRTRVYLREIGMHNIDPHAVQQALQQALQTFANQIEDSLMPIVDAVEKYSEAVRQRNQILLAAIHKNKPLRRYLQRQQRQQTGMNCITKPAKKLQP
jgi:hypothetical protein